MFPSFSASNASTGDSNAKISLAGNKKVLKLKNGVIEIPAKTSAEVGKQAAYLFVIM